MGFVERLVVENNVTETLNGAKAHKGTFNPLLDFFAKAGACRDNQDLALELFKVAYASDKKMAIRALFYVRDVRNGQGERDTFRTCFKWLVTEKLNDLNVNKIVSTVGHYGRFDDILVDDNVYLAKIATVIKEILNFEIKNPDSKISLLSKWLPSENASNKKNRVIARKLAKFMKISLPEYRKTLSKLRKRLELVETNLTYKNYDFLYEKLPSKALCKYSKAFTRNDFARYMNYLDAVNSGEKKINISGLYTYEISRLVSSDSKLAETMWSNLPDYTQGKNALVVADVSGSMSGTPMEISVSLALYFAERSSGPFKNTFITFSDEPTVQQIPKNLSLEDKLNFIRRTDWGYNTDLNKVFRLILNTAVKSQAKQDDLPEILYIISDMEFDEACNPSLTVFENWVDEFKKHGYSLPHIVFWNCNSLSQQMPVTKFLNRVTLVSGSSQNTFRYAVSNKTPLQFMNEVLTSKIYDKSEQILK